MSRFRWVQFSVITLLLGVSVSGCLGGVFNTEPRLDTRKDEYGNIIVLDTPRMWQYWRYDMDREVSREVAGARPGGGITTWNELWLRVIDQANSNRENAPKYIAYILESRRKAGLPELFGYPPNSE